MRDQLNYNALIKQSEVSFLKLNFCSFVLVDFFPLHSLTCTFTTFSHFNQIMRYSARCNVKYCISLVPLLHAGPLLHYITPPKTSFWGTC